VCETGSRTLIKNMVVGCSGTGRSGAYFDLKEELTGGVRELHSAVHHSLRFDLRRGYFDGFPNRKGRLLIVLQHKIDFKENVVGFLLTCQKPLRKKMSGRFHSSLQCFRVSRCLLAHHCHLLQTVVCDRRVCPHVLLFSSNLCRSNLTAWSYNVTVFTKISD
jgi:hypothetical protein